MILVDALLSPNAYPHSATPELIETHISQVFLTGDYAYKIKKPMDFGFLDFSTLEKRKHFCEEELRLNRRFSPDLYLSVEPVRCRDDGSIVVGGEDGDIVEYAVKMRQFPTDCLASNLAEKNTLSLAVVREFGGRIARIHRQLPASEADDIERAGIPTHWRDAMIQNFQQIRPFLRAAEDIQRLNRLEDWSMMAWKRFEARLWERYRQGFVRECHGDLHLGNLVVIDNVATAFDCIEFNASFRWCDVMNELAFLTMDCDSRHRRAHGFAALDEAVAQSGDYDGLRLLTSFVVYRAMVRAKVALFAGTAPVSVDEDRYRDWVRYSELAERSMRDQAPFMVLMCGVSGSGKSHLAALLAANMGAIRVRSDIERKRLFGLDPTDSSDAKSNMYSKQASDQTFAALEQHARSVIEAGLPAFLDATFLHRARRDQFRALASQLGVPCITLVCEAPVAVLERRIAERLERGKDPSEATAQIMHQQLKSAEWPTDDEQAVCVDTCVENAHTGAQRLLEARLLELV